MSWKNRKLQRKYRHAASLRRISDLTMMASERAASWTAPSSGVDKRYITSRGPPHLHPWGGDWAHALSKLRCHPHHVAASSRNTYNVSVEEGTFSNLCMLVSWKVQKKTKSLLYSHELVCGGARDAELSITSLTCREKAWHFHLSDSINILNICLAKFVINLAFFFLKRYPKLSKFAQSVHSWTLIMTCKQLLSVSVYMFENCVWVNWRTFFF